MRDSSPIPSDSRWGYAIFLLPLVLCGGPLLVAVGGAAVTWAALHGLWLGGGALVVAGVGAVAWWRLKRATACADCDAQAAPQVRGGLTRAAGPQN
jgi:hypothetical protein